MIYLKVALKTAQQLTSSPARTLPFQDTVAMKSPQKQLELAVSIQCHLSYFSLLLSPCTEAETTAIQDRNI
jgi:hypothetical protein